MRETPVRMIGKLRFAVPRTWTICRQWENEGVFIGNQGRRGAVGIYLEAVDPLARVQLQQGQRVLGTGSLGKILMKVDITPAKGEEEPPAKATLDDYWPGAEAAIRKALEIQPSET